MSDKETRILPVTDLPSVEVRSSEDGKRTLVGYGAVFGKRSQDFGGWSEVIDAKAFNRTLQNQKDILVTMDHDIRSLLGRTSAGTARVAVDDVGLRYEVDLPNTSAGNDVAELAARGDLFGSSFVFQTVADSWEKEERGGRLRTLKEVRLYEVGPVVSPAYLDTTVALRSLEAAQNEELEGEDKETRHDSDTLLDNESNEGGDTQEETPTVDALGRFLRDIR